VLQSESHLESRFSQQTQRGFRESKDKVRERAVGDELPYLPKRERAVGPQKSNPLGGEGDFPPKQTKRREKARDASPKTDFRDRDEARWQAVEAEIFARVVGLLAAQANAKQPGPPQQPIDQGQEARPVMHKSLDCELTGRLALGKPDTSSPRKTEGSTNYPLGNRGTSSTQWFVATTIPPL
jgi:hypothetical protein